MKVLYINIYFIYKIYTLFINVPFRVWDEADYVVPPAEERIHLGRKF